MVTTDMVERMAQAMHAFSRTQFPLLEDWHALAPERRAYQRQLATHALQALSARDLVKITAESAPQIAALPLEPNPWALAELQQAAISDNGTAMDARRRYRSLITTAALQITAADEAGAGA